jgi:hypothetical protein
MNKIAVLILAHKHQIQVNRLISHFSKDFDVYVHVDTKSKITIQKTDNVFAYKKYRTYWGSFNIVKAVLFLLISSSKKNKYERYILLSGNDLPLISNGNIETFFQRNNIEYIECFYLPIEQWDNYGNLLNKILRKIFGQFIKLDNYYSGSQWFNLTNNCVEKMLKYLSNNKEFIKTFRMTELFYWQDCSDEKFFQTLINKIDDVKIENNNLRYIDWGPGERTGHPRILCMDDYEKIMNSNSLFARKFDETIDVEVIDKIYNTMVCGDS